MYSFSAMSPKETRTFEIGSGAARRPILSGTPDCVSRFNPTEARIHIRLGSLKR